MKFVNLRGSAYVNGVLRHPHEGALHLINEEAERLISAELADDVTADFDEADVKEQPAESITTETAKPAKPKAGAAGKES